MKILSYNVNGIRSAMGKGLVEWLKATDADVICLQEIKADADQIPTDELKALGYECHFFSAKKKGYSGVGILTRIKPSHVEVGCGMAAYDDEGRILRADFGDLSVMSLYAPSGSSGDDRQAFKMQFLADFKPYINELLKQRPNLIISGDYNICHKAIDIHNPVSNAKSSGFLPEEREWMGGFMDDLGFTDTFRHFNPEPHNYTWWSFRFNSRAKNLGWRIDYHLATKTLNTSLKRALILPEAKHSDHCPILVEVGG